MPAKAPDFGLRRELLPNRQHPQKRQARATPRCKHTATPAVLFSASLAAHVPARASAERPQRLADSKAALTPLLLFNALCLGALLAFRRVPCAPRSAGLSSECGGCQMLSAFDPLAADPASPAARSLAARQAWVEPPLLRPLGNPPRPCTVPPTFPCSASPRCSLLPPQPLFSFRCILCSGALVVVVIPCAFLTLPGSALLSSSCAPRSALPSTRARPPLPSRSALPLALASPSLWPCAASYHHRYSSILTPSCPTPVQSHLISRRASGSHCGPACGCCLCAALLRTSQRLLSLFF